MKVECLEQNQKNIYFKCNHNNHNSNINNLPAVRVSTCSLVGTSLVKSNHNKLSNKGSPSPATPLKVGNTFWQSGMVKPRNRIPSLGSKLEVSHSIHLTDLAPPMHWSTVTSPITCLPCSFFNWASCVCFPGTCASRVSAKVATPRKTGDLGVCIILTV